MNKFEENAPPAWPASPNIRRLVRLALDEDLASGDVTSDLTIDEKIACTAEVIAKEDLVVCGLPIIDEIFHEYGRTAAIDVLAAEGSSVKSGTLLARISADARSLLALERTVLNFLQRLCGVATNARRFVEAAHGVSVLDTRKTMPGWRVLDKYAVRTGGARNHRGSLGDMLLIKNNHVDVGGGIRAVLERAAKKPRHLALEIEVRSLAELDEALSSSPQIVMLDNMSDPDIENAVKRINERNSATQVEVSGGITPERCARLAKLGVTQVSCGSLTTRAPNVDISMRIRRER